MIDDEMERLNKKMQDFKKMIELLFNTEVNIGFVEENKMLSNTQDYYRVTVLLSRNEVVLFPVNEMLLCTDEQLENKFWDYLFRLSRKVNGNK